MLQIDDIYPISQIDVILIDVFVAIYKTHSAPGVAERLNLALHTSAMDWPN
jgi:hypothetical protein